MEAEYSHQPSYQPSHARPAAAETQRAASYDRFLSEPCLLLPQSKLGSLHTACSRHHPPKQHAWGLGQSPPHASSPSRPVRSAQPSPLSRSSIQRDIPSRNLSFLDADNASPGARFAGERFGPVEGSVSKQDHQLLDDDAPQPYAHVAALRKGHSIARLGRPRTLHTSLHCETGAFGSTPEDMYQAARKRIGALLRPDVDLRMTPLRHQQHGPHDDDHAKAFVSSLDTAPRSAYTQAQSAAGSSGTEEYAARGGPSSSSQLTALAAAHAPRERHHSLHDAASASGRSACCVEPGLDALVPLDWSPTGRLKLRLACNIGQSGTGGDSASRDGQDSVLRVVHKPDQGNHHAPGSVARPLSMPLQPHPEGAGAPDFSLLSPIRTQSHHERQTPKDPHAWLRPLLSAPKCSSAGAEASDCGFRPAHHARHFSPAQASLQPSTCLAIALL